MTCTLKPCKTELMFYKKGCSSVMDFGKHMPPKIHNTDIWWRVGGGGAHKTSKTMSFIKKSSCFMSKISKLLISMHPIQLWWRDCSNSILLLSVSRQEMNALSELHWKWCLLGHGRGRRMKRILGRLHLKRRKLPLIPFPANKYPFEIQHRKMKRIWE